MAHYPLALVAKVLSIVFRPSHKINLGFPLTTSKLPTNLDRCDISLLIYYKYFPSLKDTNSLVLITCKKIYIYFCSTSSSNALHCCQTEIKVCHYIIM